LSVIWKTGFPYHRPQVSCENMARQPDWRQAVDRKAHQHRGSPGTALSRTKVRAAGSFGHSPSGCTLQRVHSGILGRSMRGAPGGHPTSPRCTRTLDTWRTRRAPDEPALHPHAGHVAHPEGTRRTRAAPAPWTRGAPGVHPTSPRCTRARDNVAHPESTRRALHLLAERMVFLKGTRWPRATRTRGARSAPGRVFPHVLKETIPG